MAGLVVQPRTATSALYLCAPEAGAVSAHAEGELGSQRSQGTLAWAAPATRRVQAYVSCARTRGLCACLHQTPGGRGLACTVCRWHDRGALARYTFDPVHATPAMGGASFNFLNSGPKTQNVFEARDDVPQPARACVELCSERRGDERRLVIATSGPAPCLAAGAGVHVGSAGPAAHRVRTSGADAWCARACPPISATACSGSVHLLA